jgi:ribonuclease PH
MGRLRLGNRSADALRNVRIETGYTKWAEGSVLCVFGDTHVLCTASVEDRPPPWLRESGRGWVTAEYSMLPRSTSSRMTRESAGKIRGRTQEISRLIGRSLRSAVNLDAVGGRAFTIDCDVIQADGGTRTASVTGGFVALALAIRSLKNQGVVAAKAIRAPVAAISLGVFGDEVLLDLDYEEDQAAETDLNLVMDASGGIVEIQGTAEGTPFTRMHLNTILDVGRIGIEALIGMQRQALEA